MELQKLKKIKLKQNYSIFNSKYIKKIAPKLTKRGKREQVLKIIKKLITIFKNPLKQKVTTNINKLFQKAYNNISPIIRLRAAKRGASTLYQPTLLSVKKQNLILIKWLLTALKKRSERSFVNKLLNELIAATEQQGHAVELRKEQHKIALAQKRFLGIKKNIKYKKKKSEQQYKKRKALRNCVFSRRRRFPRKENFQKKYENFSKSNTKAEKDANIFDKIEKKIYLKPITKIGPSLELLTAARKKYKKKAKLKKKIELNLLTYKHKLRKNDKRLIKISIPENIIEQKIDLLETAQTFKNKINLIKKYKKKMAQIFIFLKKLRQFNKLKFKYKLRSKFKLNVYDNFIYKKNNIKYKKKPKLTKYKKKIKNLKYYKKVKLMLKKNKKKNKKTSLKKIETIGVKSKKYSLTKLQSATKSIINFKQKLKKITIKKIKQKKNTPLFLKYGVKTKKESTLTPKPKININKLFAKFNNPKNNKPILKSKIKPNLKLKNKPISNLNNKKKQINIKPIFKSFQNKPHNKKNNNKKNQLNYIPNAKKPFVKSKENFNNNVKNILNTNAKTILNPTLQINKKTGK